MERFRILPLLLASVSIAAVCASAQAQTAPSQPTQDTSTIYLKSKPIPEKTPPMPFPAGYETPGRVHTLEFRPADKMTEKDRELEADAESSIQERTTWANMDFNQGKWSYQQLVCPALPNHMFLQFTRNNGVGDVSVFSASIPRNSDGRVRIVPIIRRGYSLFSPAPINALTISAFNHIRAEEHPTQPPDWLTTGLCYAALAGARPEAALLAENPESQKFPAAFPATMEIPTRGGAIIKFADVAAVPKIMQWTMTFDGKGRLLKATHSPAALLTEKPIPQVPMQVTGKPIPQIVVDVHGNPIADTQTAPVVKPIPQVMLDSKGIPIPLPIKPPLAKPVPDALLQQPLLAHPAEHTVLLAAAAPAARPLQPWDTDRNAIHPIPLWDPAKQAIHPVDSPVLGK